MCSKDLQSWVGKFLLNLEFPLCGKEEVFLVPSSTDGSLVKAHVSLCQCASVMPRHMADRVLQRWSPCQGLQILTVAFQEAGIKTSNEGITIIVSPSLQKLTATGQSIMTVTIQS